MTITCPAPNPVLHRARKITWGLLALAGVRPQYRRRNLIDRERGVIMGWTPKAGCTVAIKMFFDAVGRLDSAMKLNPWVHQYRERYSRAHPVSLADLNDPRLRKFKVVRNPYARAVSSFAHAMFYGYANDDIRQVLRVREPQNISFAQFVDYLERVDLTSTNQHHGYQKLIGLGEGTSYVYDRIVKVESLHEDLGALSELLQLNLRLTPLIADSLHHTEKNTAVDAPVFGLPFAQYASVQPAPRIPDHRFFYNRELKKRVHDLYRPDIEAYGYEFPWAIG